MAGHAALLLVLGAASTVAVSWAIARWMPYRGLNCDSYAIDSTDGTEGWYGYISVEEFSRPGLYLRSWAVEIPGNDRFWWGSWYLSSLSPLAIKQGRDGRDVQSVAWGQPRPVHGQRSTYEAVDEAFGWPMIAMWCRLSGDRSAGSATPLVEGGVLVASPSTPSDFSDARVLPFRAIPVGFAVDSVLYAALWGAVPLARRTIRATLRLRRHRCPSCGYSLAGQTIPGCPECGWARPRQP